MAVEKVQGISRLEQLCEEFSEEERVRELKQEKKRQKRKNRRKNKCACEIPVPLQVAEEKELSQEKVSLLQLGLGLIHVQPGLCTKSVLNCMGFARLWKNVKIGFPSKAWI